MNLTLIAKILIVLALIVLWFRIKSKGGSIKKQWLPAVIAGFLGWNILAPLVFHSNTYEGRVVDGETGDPISGAVVVVVWYDSEIIHLAQTKYYQTARETLTEEDGTFSLWNWPGISFNPMRYVFTPPNVFIYKSGYATYRTTTESSGTAQRLRKLKTRREAMSFAHRPVSYVPAYRLPLLTREVKIHRKNIGLDSQNP